MNPAQSPRIINCPSADLPLRDILSKELGISPVTAQLLINRGIKSAQKAHNFLNPSLSGLNDPGLFNHMDKAVSAVRAAVSAHKKIMVLGDYDVDGVTSLVLIKESLARLGAHDAEHYIPHRIREGYGLSSSVARMVKERGIELLITADCGTNSARQIGELMASGVDVVVTDHHEPRGAETGSLAFINPKGEESGYPFRELAGVGVAFKFCQALTGELVPDDIELVALGTIADSVPLIDENRVIVSQGLSRIPTTKRLGLKALMETGRLGEGAMSPESVSFILGPRINAAGRVDTAEIAFDLLRCPHEEQARLLARQVEDHNRQRQKIEGRILEEAEDLISSQINFKRDKVMVLAKEDWHLGVLGIVASKLADRFYRPAILISLNENELCRGSGRSIKNFHLFNNLVTCNDLLAEFGGHEHAVGMLIHRDNIDLFREKINILAEQALCFEDLIPHIEIDMELPLAYLNRKLLLELEKLAPHGKGNPKPLFLTRRLTMKGQPRLMGRDTLKFWVTDGELTYQALGFGMGRLRDLLCRAQHFDLVHTAVLDRWQGEESIVLQIEDVIFP